MDDFCGFDVSTFRRRRRRRNHYKKKKKIRDLRVKKRNIDKNVSYLRALIVSIYFHIITPLRISPKI